MSNTWQTKRFGLSDRLRVVFRRSEPIGLQLSGLFVGFASAILMFQTRNAIVATGLVAFAAVGLAFPFYMASRSSRMKPVIDSSKPLPPQATFRGPYINTGSRDVGPDYRTYPKK
ncbi:unnamed protein product [Camellia sinensis]